MDTPEGCNVDDREIAAQILIKALETGTLKLPGDGKNLDIVVARVHGNAVLLGEAYTTIFQAVSRAGLAQDDLAQDIQPDWLDG